MSMTIDRKNRVFIGGISESIRKDEIEKEFGKYGKLTSVWVAQNPPGFAFVEYERESDAEEAVREMNGSSIPGTSAKLRVEHSRGRTRGGRGGGRGGFGGGRDRYGGRGGRDFGGGGRGGSSFGGRGGGFSSRGGPYGGGRGGDRRGGSGGGGGRFDRGSRGRDRFDSGHSYSGGSSSGGHDYKTGGSYPNYRSRSPIGQGRRQNFGRDYSPAGVSNYSSGSYMQGGSSAY